MDDEDRRLFRDAMRGVRPLAAPGAVPAPRRRARPRARFARAERSEVLRESLAPGADPLAPVIEAGDELLYRRDGVSPQVFRQLRRGHFRVEGELDLHGQTRAEAGGMLTAFIAHARDRGWRVVRIVHGKGRNSGRDGPVLKPLVNALLQRMGPVLAFASGREVDGGVGATLVLLAAPRRGQGA